MREGQRQRVLNRCHQAMARLYTEVADDERVTGFELQLIDHGLTLAIFTIVGPDDGSDRVSVPVGRLLDGEVALVRTVLAGMLLADFGPAYAQGRLFG